MPEIFVVLALFAALCEGAGNALQKHGISQALPDLRASRIVSHFGDVARALLREWRWLVGGLLLVAGAVVMVEAIARGDVTVVLPLAGLNMVVAIAIGVLLLGERISPAEGLGIAAMLAGALLLATTATTSPASVPGLGEGLAAFACGTVAAAGLLGWQVGPLRASRELAYASASGILLGLGNFFLKGATAGVASRTGSFSLLNPSSLLEVLSEPFLYLLAASQVGGFLLLQAAYANGRVSLVNPLVGNVNLALTVMLGFALLHETLSAARVAGIALLMTGGTLALLGRRRAPVPRAASTPARRAPHAPLFETGRTPLAHLPRTSERIGVEIHAKLESFNPTGSIKDRPARYILEAGLREGLIGPGTTVIESSSGNFGIALAGACNKLGLPLICVSDANITDLNRFLLESLGAKLDLVSERDATGGYLLTRLAKVEALMASTPGAFCPDQYRSPWNWRSHYEGTGREIHEQMGGRVDYLFAAVSTAGTITGCARLLKERGPTRIIAVDPVGSVIFGGAPGVRHIPGAGSGQIPEILDPGLIDGVVHVAEVDTVTACNRLLREEGLFVGGSSGMVIAGIERYFADHLHAAAERPRVAAIMADRGERYFHTIYDARWVSRTFPGYAGR